MIADEELTGFGLTGKWFAMDHWDVVPDIMSMAKGMTCGYFPLAPPLIITKDEIDEGMAIMDKALEAADAYTA